MSVMMFKIIPQYKCRRCTSLFDIGLVILSVDSDDVESIVEESIGHQLAQVLMGASVIHLSNRIAMFLPHQCSADWVGVADLVGYKRHRE